MFPFGGIDVTWRRRSHPNEGRYDICTPAVTAWDLHNAWPGSEFVMVPDAGHAFSEPGIRTALLDATDRFSGT